MRAPYFFVLVAACAPPTVSGGSETAAIVISNVVGQGPSGSIASDGRLSVEGTGLDQVTDAALIDESAAVLSLLSVDVVSATELTVTLPSSLDPGILGRTDISLRLSSAQNSATRELTFLRGENGAPGAPGPTGATGDTGPSGSAGLDGTVFKTYSANFSITVADGLEVGSVDALTFNASAPGTLIIWATASCFFPIKGVSTDSIILGFATKTVASQPVTSVNGPTSFFISGQAVTNVAAGPNTVTLNLTTDDDGLCNNPSGVCSCGGSVTALYQPGNTF
jgi:hypothetical protein